MRNLNSSKSGLVSLLGAVTIATLLVIAVVYGVYTFNAYASSAHQFQGATNLSSSTNSTSTSPTTTSRAIPRHHQQQPRIQRLFKQLSQVPVSHPSQQIARLRQVLRRIHQALLPQQRRPLLQQQPAVQ